MSDFDDQGCGCCEPAAGPAEITNRPSLPAIRYRLGTHSSFLAEMLRQASRPPWADALRPWTAREPRDFGMQFLDLWAYVGDVVTFYQERIANEAFLGTATQRESVLRLAALIDYRLGPGAAATTYLAFTLDAGKTLAVPAGLRVQSVPGANEKPQKFETVEAVAADARWNRVRAFPAPQPVAPFAVGSPGGTVVDEPTRARPLAAGTKVLVYDRFRAEPKEVAALRREDTGLALAWSAPIKAALVEPAAVPYGRQFRLFGCNAPAQFTTPVKDETQPGKMRWDLQTTSFSTSAAATEFALESAVEGLKPGSELLVVHTPPTGAANVPVGKSTALSPKPFVRKGVIVSAAPKPAAVGPVQATVTHVQLEFTGTPPNKLMKADLRHVTLFELTGPAVRLATTAYPLHISGSSVFVPLAALPDFPAKRAIVLDDGRGDAHVATVDSAAPAGDHLRIDFTPALARDFATATCVLLGNVAKATHGETVAAEVLGGGDASARFQRFRLKKSPVTFVPRPGEPNGVASTLQVRVDGVLWNEGRTLLGAGPGERRYATAVADDGTTDVQFGGEPGARLPSGRNNVVARYRVGLGPDGNVRAAALTTLLDRPAGLKSAVNPVPASGGSAPEPLALARANAPNTVRTFGRIVSRRDFEDAARELAVVAKASASTDWTPAGQVVRLAVAGEGGAALGATVLRDVLADLNARRDVNQSLVVRAHDTVRVALAGRAQVDPAYPLDAVAAALGAAVANLFAFAGRGLGQPAFLSDVFRACQAVAGVVAVDLDAFRFRDKPGAALADVLTAAPHEILALDPADLDLRPQFETL